MLGFRRFKPLMNRVLIKKPEPIKKTLGGILIPLDKGETMNYGTVVDVGPGIKDKEGKFRNWLVKVGDVVLLPEHSGKKITLADEAEFYIYRDDDIMGVLSEKI